MRESESPDHLSESEVSAYLDQDLSAAARRSVEAHIDACEQCRQELIEVRRIAAEWRPEAGRRPGRLLVYSGIGTAIAAGLAIILWPGAVTTGPSRDPVRSAEPGSREGVARLEVVAPLSDSVNTTAIEFVWRSASADAYRLVVLALDGEPLWTHETGDTTARLPAGTLPGSGTWFWRVDAIADGITATTGVRRLTVVP